jgi:hypothetical protein
LLAFARIENISTVLGWRTLAVLLYQRDSLAHVWRAEDRLRSLVHDLSGAGSSAGLGEWPMCTD